MFSALFDFSFTSFITAKLIKFLYGLAMVLMALGTLAFIVTSFTQGGARGGLIAIIVGPLILLLGVMYARVVLEVLIVVFRIEQNTAELARRSRG